MKSYFVYIVACSDKSYYTGITSNLNARIIQHNKGTYKNSYTYNRRPVELKWFKEFTQPDLAIDLEKQIKGWSRRKKKALINNEYEKLIEFSKNYIQFQNKINKN